MKQKMFKSIFAFLLGMLPVGCHQLYSTKSPMEVITYGDNVHLNQDLIIFLPGITDDAEDFRTHGFVSAVQQRQLAVDMLAVSSITGYFFNNSLVERLESDVILPAKRRGYKRIWLVGISLGGLAALVYSNNRPQDIAGMLVLAPFLGKPELIEELSNAGGLKTWRPSLNKQNDRMRNLWLWLKDYLRGDSDRPLLYIGYGDKDKFAKANALLADILPKQQIFVINGRHNWATWKRLWHNVLDDSVFIITKHPASKLK